MNDKVTIDVRPTDSVADSRPGEPTWEVTELYPRQGEWTEEDYLEVAHRGRMVELCDGRLEFLPMVTPYHQDIVLFLRDMVHAFVKSSGVGGKVSVAPLPVRLWKGRLREPDVMYFRPGRIKSRHEQPDGVDLAFEVVSSGDSHRHRDYVAKRADYAKAGVSEYWIVDPETELVTVLRLQDDAYVVHGEFGSGDRASSVLLDGLVVDVTRLFEADDSD